MAGLRLNIRNLQLLLRTKDATCVSAQLPCSLQSLREFASVCESKEHVVARKKFEEEMKSQRIKWAKQQESKRQKAAEEAARAHEEMLAAKAVTAAQHREDAARRSVLHLERKRLVTKMTEKKAAENALYRAMANEIYDGLKAERKLELIEASKGWIRESELDSRIDEALANPTRLF